MSSKAHLWCAAWLNLADMVITLLVVGTGLATEINPLMAYLLHLTPWAFVAVKAALSGVMVVVVAAAGDRPVPFGWICHALTAAVFIWSTFNVLYLVSESIIM